MSPLVESRLQRAIALGYGGAITFAMLVNVWIGRGDRETLAVGAIVLALSLPLMANVRFVRRFAALLFLLLALVVPIGALSPFAAGDSMAQGAAPPGIGTMLAWLVPLELFLLASAWALDWKQSRKKPKGA